MKSLFIVNDLPCGTERVYDALRLAHALLKREPSTQVTVLLMADAVLAGKAQQERPDGYYNIERMLKRILASKGVVLLCSTCMDARGIGDAELMDGARRSTMDELGSTTGRQGLGILIATHSRTIIDACRPFVWRDKPPPTSAHTQEEAREIAAKWGGMQRG